MAENANTTTPLASGSEALRMMARGELDLDLIAEVIRSAEVVIRSYEMEVQELRLSTEQLQTDYLKERNAVDDLARRLGALHEENRLARGVFVAEIEGKRSLLGMASTLDLEALDMAGLIQERESVQRAMTRSCESVVGQRR
jgi:hypothetical protein